VNYLQRSITDVILSRLATDQVVVITGARQTGKTTLCENLLPQLLNLTFAYISFDDPDERLRFQHSAITILESLEPPLIILDEVQKIPSLFDPLKYVVDKQKKAGMNKTYILTGSSQLLLMKNIKETLAGRVALFHLYPFSFSEVSGSGASPFITTIFREKTLNDKDVKVFNTIAPDVMRAAISIRNEHQSWGGYPSVWMRKTEVDKLNWLKDYRRTYLERAIFDVGQVANIDAFAMAQKILCARTGQLFSISEVARDLSLSVNTIKRYINLLTMSFQCHLLHPWYENIGKRFIKSPKIFFPDAGLNRIILGDTKVSSGASYETWIFSELIKWKQLQPVEPDLFFYRTAGGLEIDFLLCGKGAILPLEVKASEKVSYADGGSIEKFIAEHKETSPLGIIAYRGKVLQQIRTNVWAVPDWYLFGGI
jgi:uncharacterized protein